MVAAAWAGAEDADIVVVLVDAARGLDGDTRAHRRRARKRAGRRAVLALNKIDLVTRESCCRWPTRLAKRRRYSSACS